MLSADTPDRLLEVAHKIRADGAIGALISGGCDKYGRVPLKPFLSAIGQLHREKLTLNIHSGLLDDDAARELVETGADIFSVDLLQDEETIREKLHLNAGPEDYERTIDSLASAGASVVPHVCVGLQSTESEDQCIRVLQRSDIVSIVALALMPIPGESPLIDIDERLVRFVERASQTSVPVLVGCMRPRGKWEMEVKCILAGAAGMVSPSLKTIKWLEENGYEIIERKVCCSLHKMATDYSLV